MTKLLHTLSLLVAMATVGTLAGCELYFGDHGHNHPGGTGGGLGSGGGGSGSGYECTGSQDCSAGCYCKNGTCEEGGFCTTNADCGPGYHCNTDRSSCEPGCSSNSDCSQGQICDTSTSTCTATCVCSTDAQAVKDGFGYCDETRMTCMPGSDPNGSCAGNVTCTTGAPTCPSGQVPTILNGCWTGNCEPIASCDAKPVCANINDETDCLARTDCAALYTGINCKKPDGTACHTGDTNCTCQSFSFHSCAAKSTAARVMIDDNGNQIDISTLQLQ